MAATVMAVNVMAQAETSASNQNKMAFVVEGSEDVYNRIRVVNHTSQSDFQCRVVYLNDDNTVKSLYGIYYLKGNKDSDSNSSMISRGTRMGIQMPGDFPVPVNFTIEYKDYPIYDMIIIHINEQDGGYDNSFN